jgi:hypothetical protein
MGSFLEVAHIYGLLSSAVKVVKLSLTKKWIGLHIGRFFSQIHLVALEII